MRTFISSGATLDVVAPANVVSGQLMVVGDLVGVAVTTAIAGTTVAVKRGGIFEFAKVSAQNWGIGTPLFLDATNLLTSVPTGRQVGVAAEPAANPSGIGRVMLLDFLA